MSRVLKIRDAACSSRRPLPWSIGGVDHGPSLFSPRELARWAFDLAVRRTADWPRATAQLERARRWLIEGHHPLGGRAAEDVEFAAGFLARMFEDELGLSMSDAVWILDRIGLPTDDVPLAPRR
jgi:hypothetical protein